MRIDITERNRNREKSLNSGITHIALHDAWCKQTSVGARHLLEFTYFNVYFDDWHDYFQTFQDPAATATYYRVFIEQLLGLLMPLRIRVFIGPQEVVSCNISAPPDVCWHDEKRRRICKANLPGVLRHVQEAEFGPDFGPPPSQAPA